LEPRGVWLRKHYQPVAAPEGVCAFAQELAMLAEAYPKTALVFTTACDQMRRTADTVACNAGSRIFLFNLPATWQSAAARRLYHAELARLGKHLEVLGGHAPTAEELATVIHDHEGRRAELRSLVQQSPARQGAEALANWFYGDSSLVAPADATTQGVRLALVGGPLLPSHWPLFNAIAAAGGCVVLNATEPGERCLLPPLPKLTTGREPLIALADHYFDHAVDVFHRPNSRLYDWLRPRLAERQARGIVLWHYVGCDLWRAEAQPLREAFGLPVLLLEADGAALPRNTGRIEAFLESLH
jgi:benzoyl-CoA reductase/2-hydroxyglutaryl-CoA dehydratase subunit BcrC/BadD/HgdB